MQGERPTVEESASIGNERMHQLIDIQSSDPSEFFSRLEKLSWIRLAGSNTLANPGAFHVAFLELVTLLQEIVFNQRGPAVLGYFERLELIYSAHFGATYNHLYRVVRVNLGVLLYVNELGATYRWLDSVILNSASVMPLDEISRVEAPADVQDELRALLAAGEGGLPVTGKLGLTHPIGLALLRFAIAHELGHLIDLGESQRLQDMWRENAWADYNDALQYGLSARWIDQAGYARLQRTSLDERVAARWGREFVADGLGFYTASRIPPPNTVWLQIAVEVFFHSLVAVYRGDTGSETHPSPMLRSTIIRAGQRKLRRVGWPEFLAQHWGPGFITSELLATAIRKIGR